MLITNAYAQAASAATPGFSLQTMIFPVLMIVVFYFLLIRPQQKRAKDQRNLIEALKAGDEVITAGGLLGRVSKVVDQYVTLDVAQPGSPPVEVLVQKSAVQTLLPKGTMKAL